MTHPEFAGKHVLSASQFSKEGIDYLFGYARRLKGVNDRSVGCHIFDKHILGSFFFEESTRTRISTEVAFQRMGGKIVTFTDMQFSSMTKKNESFGDTIAVLSQYCDVIVSRFKLQGDAKKAAEYSNCPIINAGDGKGEHPTQSLLDLFTIIEKVESLEGKKIALVGDLWHGRTVHSLIKIIMQYCEFASFLLASPKGFRIPEKLKDEIKEANFEFTEFDDLEPALSKADVLYMVRPQSERMKPDESEQIAGRYVLTRSLIEKHCRKSVPLILHPLPRNAEISTDVDDLPEAVYLNEQIQSGILVRMALLLLVLERESKLL